MNVFAISGVIYVRACVINQRDQNKLKNKVKSNKNNQSLCVHHLDYHVAFSTIFIVELPRLYNST